MVHAVNPQIDKSRKVRKAARVGLASTTADGAMFAVYVERDAGGGS